MKGLLRGVFIGAVLALLVARSAAMLSDTKPDKATVAAFDARDNTGVNAGSNGADGDAQSVHQAIGLSLAQVDWGSAVLDIPPGFGSIVAGACLILPFGYSAWATLRKRV